MANLHRGKHSDQMAPFTQKATILTVTTAVLVLTPVFLIAFLGLKAARLVLTLVKRIWDPSYGPLLSGVDNQFSIQSPYEPECTATIGTYFTFETPILLDEFKPLAHSRLSKLPLYPQLQYYLTTWFGFSVWRKDAGFKIDNHIRNLPEELYIQVKGDPEPLEQDDVLDFLNNFNKIGFQVGRPPWDLHLCHKVVFRDETTGQRRLTTVLFLRVHHVLADGYVFWRIMTSLFDNKEGEAERIIFQMPKKKVQNRSFLSNLWFYCSYPALAVYETMDKFFTSRDENEWLSSKTPTRIDFHFVRATVEKNIVNKIRRTTGVSFFSVVLAGLTAALRRHMITHGVAVPEAMHAVSPIPAPSTGNSIGNNVSLISLTLPVSLSCRQKILQKIHWNQHKLRTSKITGCMLAIGQFQGCLPKKLIETNIRSATCNVSNFPFFEFPPEFNGTSVIDSGGALVVRQTLGIQLFSFGFGERLQLCLGVSKDIMADKPNVQELARNIVQEIHQLQDIKTMSV